MAQDKRTFTPDTDLVVSAFICYAIGIALGGIAFHLHSKLGGFLAAGALVFSFLLTGKLIKTKWETLGWPPWAAIISAICWSVTGLLFWWLFYQKHMCEEEKYLSKLAAMFFSVMAGCLIAIAVGNFNLWVLVGGALSTAIYTFIAYEFFRAPSPCRS